MSETLFLSVIVPVRNESAHIEEVLERLLEQDYDREKYEILVIDGLSEDQTREKVLRYCEKHSNIHLHENPRKLSSAARNIGIQKAQGDIILLIDGHCIIDSREIFRNTNEGFQNPEVACMGRPQPLELSHASPLQLAIATARRSPLGHHPDSFIYAGKPCFSPAISVAVAYRKSIFEQVGFFDERFDAAEDCELNHRIDKAGLKCLFSPQIAVRYVPRATLGGLAKQLIRYGKGRVRLSRKHPETFSWKSFIPGAFVGGILTGLVLCAIWIALFFAGISSTPLSLSCCVFLGVMGLYTVIVLLESLRIAFARKKYSYVFLLPGVFATIHLASGWGLFFETLFPEFR